MHNINNSACPANVKRILAVSIGGMGDTILFSPVLKALRFRYPDAEIELLLANSLARSIYKHCKEITRASVVDINQKFLVRKIFELTRFAIKSRMQRGFDIGVFAVGLNTKLSILLKYLAGISNIVSAPVPPAYSTDLECNTALARIFFENINENDVFISKTRASRKEAEEVAKLHGISLEDKNIIAVCPSTELWIRPRWQLSKINQLIEMIRKDGLDCQVVIIGTFEEGREWRVAVGDTPEIINLAGKLSILASAYLISKCFLAICNDGGLMHLAGAVGCPTVAVMPNAPKTYKPPGRDTRMIQSNLPCSGCYPHRPKTCNYAYCTEDITVEEVFQACHDLILALCNQQAITALP